MERIDTSFLPQYRIDPALFQAFVGRMLANDPHSYAAIHRMLAAMDVDADLPNITCPVMVLAGATDQTRPAALVQSVAARIPGARFAVVPSGHVMPMLTPALVAETLEAFLREGRDKISSETPAKLV
jgi:3-oxoadipate enol-lactonase